MYNKDDAYYVSILIMIVVALTVAVIILNGIEESNKKTEQEQLKASIIEELTKGEDMVSTREFKVLTEERDRLAARVAELENLLDPKVDEEVEDETDVWEDDGGE